MAVVIQAGRGYSSLGPQFTNSNRGIKQNIRTMMFTGPARFQFPDKFL